MKRKEQVYEGLRKTDTELEWVKQSKEQAFPKWTMEQVKMRKVEQ